MEVTNLIPFLLVVYATLSEGTVTIRSSHSQCKSLLYQCFLRGGKAIMRFSCLYKQLVSVCVPSTLYGDTHGFMGWRSNSYLYCRMTEWDTCTRQCIGFIH